MPDDGLNPFELPYFLRRRDDGLTDSRAGVILGGLAEDNFQGLQQLALLDFRAVDDVFDADDEANRKLLSEAIISAIALGLELGQNGIPEACKKLLSERNKKAADALHNAPGGSREKRETIRAIWATGKYDNRDLCAEQECAGLGMSLSTARKALRNTPDPKKSRD